MRRPKGFRWSIARAALAALIVAAIDFAACAILLLTVGSRPFSGSFHIVAWVMLLSLVLIIPLSVVAGAFDGGEWRTLVIAGSILMILLSLFLTLVLSYGDGMASFR